MIKKGCFINYSSKKIKKWITAANEPSAKQCGRVSEGDIHQIYKW